MTSFIFVGVFHSLIALTFSSSICTSLFPTHIPSMGISVILKLHFDYLKHRLCFSTILRNLIVHFCKEAKLQAGIKPTALCSAIDKENSIEFLLDFLHYLYNYYMVCALLSHAYHVTHHVTSCDVTL